MDDFQKISPPPPLETPPPSYQEYLPPLPTPPDKHVITVTLSQQPIQKEIWNKKAIIIIGCGVVIIGALITYAIFQVL